MHPYKKQLVKWRKRREQVKAWKVSGMSLAEIGRKIGVSRQRVAKMVEAQ